MPNTLRFDRWARLGRPRPPDTLISRPFPLTLAYVAVGLAWIVLSDRALDALLRDSALVTLAQTYKGAAFVLVSGAVLYSLLRMGRAAYAGMADALNTQNEALRALIQASPLPIVVLDRSGSVRAWSPSAADALGWAEEEVVGKPFPQIAEPGNAELQAALGRVLEGEPIVNMIVQQTRKDGTRIDVQIWAAAARADMLDGKGIVAILQDVTTRTRFEHALREAKERAEEMSSLRSTVLANLSHEIRTPLTSIIGFADVLRGETEGEPREFAELIGIAGSRLLETLNSVLDLAQLESRHVPMLLQPVALAGIARDVVSIFEHRAHEKELSLVLECEEPSVAMADRVSIHRILSNLVSNAIKFTQQGGVHVRIDTAAERVVVRVSDTGIGMSEEFMPRLFQEFEQESTGLARRYEGSGLGLHITKRLVELMAGEISVESEKGRGTTFTVSLPTANTEAEAG